MLIPARSIEASQHLSRQLAERLAESQRKIVFAESCTAGLVSALMAQIPGISHWLCGSAVTYMSEVKTEWLGVPTRLIEQFTAVSPQASQALAGQVLARTRMADLSAGVTGHLEPSATSDHQPVALIGMAERCGDRIVVSPIEQIKLTGGTRVARQWEAALAVLDRVVRHLQLFDAGGQSPKSDARSACPRCRRIGHDGWSDWSPFPPAYESELT